MKITIHSNAWGDYKYLRNRALLAISNDVNALIASGVEVNYHLTDYDAENLNLGIVEAAQRTCEEKDHVVFYLPPDTLFSEGSLVSLIHHYGDEPVHVAVPHLRVDRERENFSLPCAHEEMVKQAWDILHYTARLSKYGIEPSVRHKGITLRRTGMEHAIPTIYYCNFDRADAIWLADYYTRKYLWDNQWTANCFSRGKLRIVGSASMACCFETTNAADNHPDAVEGARFDRTAMHNCACRCMTYVY
jgi:hypothetical protein